MNKNHKDREQNLEAVNYFADIFLVNIYRICKYLVSKKPKYEAILIFDGVALILTEYVIYLLGGIKIIGQGDFRFIWLFGAILLAPILICGLIGILRRKHDNSKEQNIEVRIANEKNREYEEFIKEDDVNLGFSSQYYKDKLAYIPPYYPDVLVTNSEKSLNDK